MRGLRVIVTFIIVLTIFLLSLFMMQLRGYEKIERIGEYTLYYKEETCNSEDIATYTTIDFIYVFTCTNDETYIVKSGFDEHSLIDALEGGYIEISDIEDIIQYTIITNE